MLTKEQRYSKKNRSLTSWRRNNEKDLAFGLILSQLSRKKRFSLHSLLQNLELSFFCCIFAASKVH